MFVSGQICYMKQPGKLKAITKARFIFIEIYPLQQFFIKFVLFKINWFIINILKTK